MDWRYSGYEGMGRCTQGIVSGMYGRMVKQVLTATEAFQWGFSFLILKEVPPPKGFIAGESSFSSCSMCLLGFGEAVEGGSRE